MTCLKVLYMPDNKYHFRNGYMISEDICFKNHAEEGFYRNCKNIKRILVNEIII